MGSKGRGLAKLQELGVIVPEFFVVPCDALDSFLSKDVSRSSHMESLKRGNKVAAESLRNEILKHVDNGAIDLVPNSWLSRFSPSETFAVRSSAESEDTEDAAFAGLYLTKLNVRGHELHRAIIECWASLFDSKVLKYAERCGVEGDVFNRLKMAVVVMRQIDSAVSGVCFSHDPSGEKGILIEAAFGQGEAVVSGAVIPDRWHVQGDEIRAKLGKKGKKLELSATSSGLIDVSVPENVFCLTDSQVKDLARTVSMLEQRHGPCDVEWCFDKSGKLWLLQMRPITVVFEKESWNAPGPGPWFYDTTHYPKRLTKIFQAVIPDIVRAWTDSPAMVGSLLGGGAIEIVNSVAFLQLRPLPPHDAVARFEEGANYLQRKGYLAHFKEWTEKVIPGRLTAHMRLKNVDLVSLSDDDLLKHFRAAVDNLKESFYFHHAYNFPMFTGLGWFMLRGSSLTGIDPDELLQFLRPTSSEWFWDESFAAEFSEALKGEPDVAKLLTGEVDGNNLTKLVRSTGKVGKLTRDWLQKFDHYTLSSLDASSPTFREEPEAVIRALQEITKERQAPKEHAIAPLLEKIKDTSARVEFLKLYDEAQLMATWRDQRGYVNDVQASGLLRFALKEIGRRIAKNNRIFSRWEHLLDCCPEEVEAIFLGRDHAPSEADLKARFKNRVQRPLQCPPFLGEPPGPPPDLSGLPDGIREAEQSRGLFLMRLFSPPPAPSPDSNDNSAIIRGIPANPGRVVGIARLIKQQGSWSKIQKGDIGVVDTTDCAFNSVLPLLSGLGILLCFNLF